MLKVLVIAITLLLPQSSLQAEEAFSLKQLLRQVNTLEEISPGLFKESLKEDSIKILKENAENTPHTLAVYLSSVRQGVEDSYSAGHINIANQKLELLRSLFNKFEPDLEQWQETALVDMAKADFLRWIYTNQKEYKRRAEERFAKAEKIGLKKTNTSLSQNSVVISRNSAILNSKKNEPLTGAQLAAAESIGFSAYQHIAIFEEAINIKARLKASQDELSALAQDGLDTFHSANQRLQPNTLGRAYVGLLMSIESHLDKQHLKAFESEIMDAKMAFKLPMEVARTTNPFKEVEDFVKAGKMDDAINALDAYESFALKRFEDSAYTITWDIERYRKRCPESDHLIINKLTKHNPERMKLYNSRICDAIKSTLEAQGKWLE